MVGDLVEQEQGPGGGFLAGHISVGAVLEAQSREIYAIQISKTNRDPLVRQIEQRARALGVPVQRVEPAVIEAQASGHTHGGVLAQVGPRKYRPLRDLLTLSACPFIVMLDGIEDPLNFGAAVRCLYAAGVDGLVLRPRNWMSAAAVVARASGGPRRSCPPRSPRRRSPPPMR